MGNGSALVALFPVLDKNGGVSGTATVLAVVLEGSASGGNAAVPISGGRGGTTEAEAAVLGLVGVEVSASGKKRGSSTGGAGTDAVTSDWGGRIV